ncbi:MAG: UvrB/UvrC motif-containing protein, partial [Corallincola sp.]|nr:UvrB/UvrC motif-containing protein [Corallincola sp.]
GSAPAAERARRGRKVAEPAAPYSASLHNSEELLAEIKRLEKQMYEHARNLEFEQAAALRDEVARLHEALVKLG